MKQNKIRLTETQLHRVIRKSISRILENLDYDTLDGYKYQEWVDKVRQTLNQWGYEDYAQDEGFVEYIAENCWQTVQNGQSDNLEQTLFALSRTPKGFSSNFSSIDQEYDIYVEKGWE